ncbi:MAG TPA: ATP-binding cassette domain-containing protein [Thermoanaerobaculia bacterium]|jgi:putative ABC transport system ATP-binding protein|nr:ATP-binding cassette domain-containing protein [Thermoanaerobaculia bacterium]
MTARHDPPATANLSTAPESAPRAPLVRIAGAERRHGNVVALAPLDLEVAAGEWLSVTGPSGSGKTTLLNLLSGLDRPTAGSVQVGGEEVSRLSGTALARYRRERIGLVFQEFHLVPYLSALDNVMLAQHVHSLADRGQAEAALVRVGLAHRLRHLPAQLSGGEKQRVCVARALINHPPLLLADEPTGNLDAQSEAEVLALLAELHAAGQTLVVVTHNAEVAARGDRIVRLEHGHLVGEQRPLDDEETLLLRLWLRRERGETPTPRELAGGDRLGWAAGNGAAPPAALHARAAALVRRQRLAEVLVARTLQAGEPPACGTVPPVQPEREAAIAELLGHPTACPHGLPIPAAD